MSTDVSPTHRRGRRVVGPSARGDDPVRLWHLTRTLAVTDFKLRFFGSVLGYFWQLLRPLLLFGVLYVVFTEVVRLGGDVELYAPALLLGIVLYTFMTEATGGALTSMVDRESLIRKIDFPRLAVPMANVLTALFSIALNVLVVLVFLLLSGGKVRWTWLELPLIIAWLTVLAAGLGMLLSALYVKFRDVRPIWDVVLQVFFYASPIFYPIDVVLERNESLATLLMLNPFAAALQQARHAVVAPSHPSAAEAIGDPALLLIPIAITLMVVAGGYAVFSRRAPRIAEDL
ncbi:MAG TPA: ABC transporter permease [Solirubrobacter sp.]|nr:ABC transporter permease [Solirubrobacter sp.]